jgi:predicted P-loop ATPase
MSNISLFKSLPQKGQHHECSEQLSIVDFLNFVKYGKWKNIIEPIREEPDKKKRDAMKRNVPSVTISGVFDVRSEENLIQHSGFICIDIDYFTDKSELLNDIYTFALMKSASGGGLAVVVKINPEKHKESFRWLQNYYYQRFGIVVDRAPSNVASLRFVSFDPELKINEKSKTSKTLVLKAKKINSLPIVLDGSKVADLVAECVNSGKNIAPDYESYLNLGFALADGFGENGRGYFHSLCSCSEKYDSRHADKQYNECLKNRKQGVTVGTFYFMVKNLGIEIKTDTQKYVQLATIGKKSKRTPEGVAQQISQIEGVEISEARKLVNEVYARDDMSVTSAIGDPEKLIESLIEWMQQNHPIRKNAITRMIEENGNDVKTERLNTIYLRARMFFNSEKVTKDLCLSIIFSDLVHEFNPITEYIEKNIHRKSIGNIDTLCKSIRSNTEMKNIFIRKWVISLIAAYDGNPVRSVLALVGGQNSGKTEWFRRLLPNQLKRYYAESKLDAGNDDDILMCEKLIVMDDEMGGKSKQDEKRFKELTSKDFFSLRVPYGKCNEDYKRLAVLCGTSNDPEVINDPTGNTRILPVDVLSIDHELFNSIDKDELFMEAYRAYESGDEWRLNREEIEQLNLIGKDFETVAFESELILKFFKPVTGGEIETQWLTTTDIKNTIETLTKQRIVNLKRFGIELKKIFGKSVPKKINGTVQNRYFTAPTHNLTKTQNNENEGVPF